MIRQTLNLAMKGVLTRCFSRWRTATMEDIEAMGIAVMQHQLRLDSIGWAVKSIRYHLDRRVKGLLGAKIGVWRLKTHEDLIEQQCRAAAMLHHSIQEKSLQWAAHTVYRACTTVLRSSVRQRLRIWQVTSAKENATGQTEDRVSGVYETDLLRHYVESEASVTSLRAECEAKIAAMQKEHEEAILRLKQEHTLSLGAAMECMLEAKEGARDDSEYAKHQVESALKLARKSDHAHQFAENRSKVQAMRIVNRVLKKLAQGGIRSRLGAWRALAMRHLQDFARLQHVGQMRFLMGEMEAGKSAAHSLMIEMQEDIERKNMELERLRRQLEPVIEPLEVEQLALLPPHEPPDTSSPKKPNKTASARRRNENDTGLFVSSLLSGMY